MRRFYDPSDVIDAGWMRAEGRLWHRMEQIADRWRTLCGKEYIRQPGESRATRPTDGVCKRCARFAAQDNS